MDVKTAEQGEKHAIEDLKKLQNSPGRKKRQTSFSEKPVSFAFLRKKKNTARAARPKRRSRITCYAPNREVLPGP